jgi:transcriptional regulator
MMLICRVRIVPSLLIIESHNLERHTGEGLFRVVYLPQHFAESDTDAMHGVIREFPLGTLITMGPDGLAANHVPFILDPRTAPNGRLLAHVARNNPVWQEHDPEIGALVVFQAADAYISPNWYPSKQESGEVVPTWNYVVVHVYGSIIVHEDAKWIRGQAGTLTKQQESGQPRPWKMADAPPPFTAGNLEKIVGIEIPIDRLIGKSKASQNRTEADRNGAIASLRQTGDPGDAAMADHMEKYRNS